MMRNKWVFVNYENGMVWEMGEEMTLDQAKAIMMESEGSIEGLEVFPNLSNVRLA